MTAVRKRPLPYYRWYVRDHRAHRLCASLNCFEEGMLRRLLDEQWEEGAVPDDARQIALIVREPIGVVTQTWEKLRELFDPIPGMDGLYVRNGRLEEERTAADALRALNSVKGKKGGRPAKAEQSRGFQGELDMSGKQGIASRGNDFEKPTKADETREYPASQESSSRSSSREEKSRRESGPDTCLCGGRDGFHRPDCILVRFERTSTTLLT